MQVEIRDFRADVKNTRQGYCTVAFPETGMQVVEVAVHKFVSDQGARWWVALPARGYKNESGEQKWFAFIRWGNRNQSDEFQRLALKALGEAVPALGIANGRKAF